MKPYGIIAEFDTPEDLVRAARQARDRGFRRIETYTPFPVPEIEDIIRHRNWLPLVVLICGATGTLTGYLLQTYIAVYDYPINVGGRPLHSWPSFVVIMFELTVLFAAFGAFFGTLIFNGLPRPYHPVGNARGFEAASQNRFYLAIEAADPQFDAEDTARFLASLNPERVEHVAG